MHCSFDNTKNRLNHYRGQDSMEMFCNAAKIINCEKKGNDTINL